MSIYSGFATRFQEESYDHCIDSLLYVLQKRVIKFYQNEPADDDKFANLVIKLHHQMRSMEKSKYLDPKSSQAVAELVKFMQGMHENMAFSAHNSKEKQLTEQLQEDPKAALSEPANEKKKNPFWVEKETAEERCNKEQEVQTMGTLNKKALASTEEQREFKRTTFQTHNMRALNAKNASKSNLSREKSEKRTEAEKKSRAMSHYITDKPQISSNVTYYANTAQSETNHNIQRRKIKSTSRANNTTELHGNNEVSDIIKDYIIKAKKSYIKGRPHKDRDSIAIHDF